jgi:hypothetical protein
MSSRTGPVWDTPPRSRAGYRAVVARSIAAVVALALALPGLARAQGPAIAGARQGALALAQDGTPRIADLERNMIGYFEPSWRGGAVVRLPSSNGRIAGFELGRRGTPYVLAEDRGGRWLVLATRAGARWKTVRIARPSGAARLGRAGLALDRRGRPVVAYAVRYPSQKTYLRLADGLTGRSRPVTRKGFPPSVIAPAAAPVLLSNGRTAVVEAYATRGTATLLWRQVEGAWWARFLHAAALGLPTGPVLALASGTGVVAAWSVVYPTLGQTELFLARLTDRARSRILVDEAQASALALGPDGAEVGANIVVGGLIAGLVASEDGTTVELDGAVLSLEVGADGSRQFLLAREDGLYAYRAPTRPSTHTTLSASRRGAQVALSGRLDAPGGLVEVYRERPGAGRVLVATVTAAADGSFTAVDEPGPEPAYYRAVYDEPLTGVPYAALTRAAV